MSKPQSVHDHGSWAGTGSKGNPLPMGNKEKYYTSADGVGKLGTYEDTTEAIKAQQEANNRKAHSNPFKPGQRN